MAGGKSIQINATSKTIQQYYADLEHFRQRGIIHEMATRSAFQSLLGTLAHEVDWLLVPEQALDNGKRPDGTLRDTYFPRGYWEAKDTHDDLRAEAQKKLAAGYPTINTIFEDTEHAILYQDGTITFEANLRDPKQLVTLLTAFFSHTKPEYIAFERAVTDFHEQIPSLATALLTLIRSERDQNLVFRHAFTGFYAACAKGIDPDITVADIDEMLVQHLLTERLLRTVFQSQDFIRSNAIAREIEEVIAALTSRTFDRNVFLRPLDRFYVAIEEAARTIPSWQEKQQFLNVVYERFFQGYSIRRADTHGIVYTPPEIVDFMVTSVEQVLASEFARTLADHEVQVLDPCTGTGNFIVHLLRRVPLSALEEKYDTGLYANEIMLLPYYIASLNIEHAYFERTHVYQAFEGICFADTLRIEGQQMEMFGDVNALRIEQEKGAPVMVVIGNPPYNVGQENENDNNKNRRYPEIERRVRETYAKDSQATNKNALGDPYVKFFRWATDRLHGPNGIVCFVSNNSFVDQIAFDGMRKHLLRDFTRVYHLDLHGNVRRNPKLSGTTHNVFGIQVGVGITIAIRSEKHTEREVYYYRVPEDWRKTRKLAFLAEAGGLDGIPWQRLTPDERATWLTEGLRPEFASYLPLGSRETKALAATGTVNIPAIFHTYSNGVKANRDQWVYDFDRDRLTTKMLRFIDTYNSEMDRWKRRGAVGVNIDDFVTNDDTRIKWSRDLKLDLQRGHEAEFGMGKLRHTLYRPFCRQWLFFDRILNEEVYQFPQFFPTAATEAENRVIVATDIAYRSSFSTLVTSFIPDLHLLASVDAFQCFPYYVYDQDGSNRRENITDWALAEFREAYGPEVTKRDIFHYVYGLLHHPVYRERYAENLKRELPRLPLVESAAAFQRCVQIGRRLTDLHLSYETQPEYPLRWVEHPEGSPNGRVTFHVRKMKLSQDRTSLAVNETLTLEDIPDECFEYRLGNRSALEWVIDQYQISEDKRSGIVSDPNRREDPQYIVRLVGKVVTVSVETVKLVRVLTAEVRLPEPVAVEVAVN